MYICKHPIALYILFEIDFYKMSKQLSAYIADNIRFTYLACTIDEQNLLCLFL